MSTELTTVSSWKSFDGYQKVYEFLSKELDSPARFGVYLPPGISEGEKLPVLFYLSGLTCTEANFIEKSGIQRYAAARRVIVVNPDTSPRHVDIEGDEDSYDFGKGAGFYLDATVDPWSKNYRMYSYIVKELTQVVFDNLPVDPSRVGIFGHSMGGHGAITIGLKNPTVFRSISAFAPICNPTSSPWGQKALKGYLGADTDSWKQYDSTELAKVYAGPPRTIFIDQGDADNFYKGEQLLPETLSAVKNDNLTVDLKLRPGYDHSYYFISSHIEEHVDYHLASLQ